MRLAATAERARPLRIAWDPGHGATADTVRRLTRRIPGGHILINAEVDGRFPAHHPDPSVAKNLQALRQTVLDTKADLGLAFDGDGDRLGVVDSEGEILWPDQYLLYLAREVLARRPGAAIVADVKCSRTLFEGVRRLGGRPVAAPSGYARVREVMRANGAPLAGELSGHVFYDDCWDGADDALYAAMRLIQAMSQGAGSLAEFRRVPAADLRHAGAAHPLRRPAPAPESWPRSRARSCRKAWTPTCWTGSGWRRTPAGGCCGRRAPSPC